MHLDNPIVDKSIVSIVGWIVKSIKKIIMVIKKWRGVNRIMVWCGCSTILIFNDTPHHMMCSVVFDLNKSKQKLNLKDTEKNDDPNKQTKDLVMEDATNAYTSKHHPLISLKPKHQSIKWMWYRFDGPVIDCMQHYWKNHDE